MQQLVAAEHGFADHLDQVFEITQISLAQCEVIGIAVIQSNQRRRIAATEELGQHQQPAHPSIPIEKRMNRLKLVMVPGDLDSGDV